jgi:hypothetical protein
MRVSWVTRLNGRQQERNRHGVLQLLGFCDQATVLQISDWSGRPSCIAGCLDVCVRGGIVGRQLIMWRVSTSYQLQWPGVLWTVWPPCQSTTLRQHHQFALTDWHSIQLMDWHSSQLTDWHSSQLHIGQLIGRAQHAPGLVRSGCSSCRHSLLNSLQSA